MNGELLFVNSQGRSKTPRPDERRGEGVGGEGQERARRYKLRVPRPKPNRSKSATLKARHARQNPSVAEEIVWSFLRNRRLGFKFRREYPVLDYRVDFSCAEANLAVEFDGEQHEPIRDAIRDKRLGELGIEVMRIPSGVSFCSIVSRHPTPAI